MESLSKYLVEKPPIQRVGNDLELYNQLVSLDKKVQELWNLYWITKDAKKINEKFLRFFSLMTKYRVLAENSGNFEMKTLWSSFRKSFPSQKFKPLFSISKAMNADQIVKTKNCIKEIQAIYGQ